MYNLKLCGLPSWQGGWLHRVWCVLQDYLPWLWWWVYWRTARPLLVRIKKHIDGMKQTTEFTAWGSHRIQKHNGGIFEVNVEVVAQESRLCARKTLENLWIQVTDPRMNRSKECIAITRKLQPYMILASRRDFRRRPTPTETDRLLSSITGWFRKIHKATVSGCFLSTCVSWELKCTSGDEWSDSHKLLWSF